MTLLAELATDGQDERLRRGIEFMLADTKAGVGKEGHGWVFLWGNTHDIEPVVDRGEPDE